ncbi:MAG: hypothetical protein UW91_C0069G0009, partial [Parcubacteria group bacterium GW2011_GWF2_45_11]
DLIQNAPPIIGYMALAAIGLMFFVVKRKR